MFITVGELAEDFAHIVTGHVRVARVVVAQENIHLVLERKFRNSLRQLVFIGFVQVILALFAASSVQRRIFRAFRGRSVVKACHFNRAGGQALQLKVRFVLGVKSGKAPVAGVATEQDHVAEYPLNVVHLFQQLLPKLRMDLRCA